MRSILIVLFVATCNSLVFSQRNFVLKDYFTERNVIWFGIDYSRSNFVGNFTGKELNDYFYGWNRLIVDEPAKYNLVKYLHKSSVEKEIESVNKINAATTPNVTVVDDDSTLTKPVIAKMISGYQTNRTEGIGVVMLVERYNRPKNIARHAIVIFDIATRKVLISQLYETAPGGNGVRNYWATSILVTMRLIYENYHVWLKKYS